VRILHVISDPARRGAQVFAQDLGGALTSLGHDVETVALAPVPRTGSAIEAQILGRGARDPRALRALRERMASVDITIAHGASTGPACALVAGRRRPFVYRQISDSRFWAPSRARRTRVRLALSRAHLVVALSEYNRLELAEWIGVPIARIRVIPNGVPTASFPVVDDDRRRRARADLGLDDVPTVAVIGALVPEKGVDVAMRWLADHPTNAQLVIAGDGPERKRLEVLASAAASGRARFLGSVTEVLPVYHASDVVAFPTRGGDAMPAAVIEAGLCGIPVVATEIGAIPEVVHDGVTGVVTPPDDDRAFADAISQLLREPARRQFYGGAARERCLREYSIDVVAEAWERVLGEAATA
jgi:glycosyltransferase involved in cell wall biosynthesis